MRGATSRWPIARLALVLALVAAPAAAVAPALAGGAGVEHRPSLDRMVRFLQESQRPSGGFAAPGKKPSQGISSWVALALAAAGVNPRDQATCGVDVFTYLESHLREGLEDEIAWPQLATTAFERELLMVDAAGADPHAFAGYDLVAEILARKLPDGSYPYVPGGRGEVNDTAFAVLALSLIDESAARQAVQEGADWLLTQQNDDGGWSWEVKGSESEVDLTGAAIQALVAAGRVDTDAEEEAFAYLRSAQRADGGFAEFPGREPESNVASTAWAVQGIWAAGDNPEAWLTGSSEPREPLDYMESMQQPDGHARWRRSSDLNGIWMTAYVAPAFAGQALPIAAVPRTLATAPAPGSALPDSCAETAVGPEPPAPGAESPKPGDGVLASGGGAGAPLFSRPQPQSKGRTAGGARIVRNQDPHPTDHSAIRRGANLKQPRGTESAEPAAADPPREEAELVGVGASSTGPGAGSSAPGSGAAGARSVSTAEGGQETPAAQSRSGDAAAASLGSKAGHGGGDGREVSGLVVGGADTVAHPGQLAFGAPGLRSAGAGGGDSPTAALALAAMALALALLGACHEHRRQELTA